MLSLTEYFDKSAFRANEYPFECKPELCIPIITSFGFILSPKTISFFESIPTTIPARSNPKPLPEIKSDIIAVSPPTIGIADFFAPFTNPDTICLNIF